PRWLKRAPAPDAPEASGGDQPQRDAPSRVAHYRIARKLGAGGMGIVYQAYDERLQRTIALKMMLGLQADETARKRMWREARAAASVNHPNVCQIYDIGEDRDHLFLTMELVEGEPLTERLPPGAASASGG